MNDTLNQKTPKNIMERIARFFIFLAVFLFAVTMLMILHSRKSDFDKTQKASFIIISSDDKASASKKKQLGIQTKTDKEIIDSVAKDDDFEKGVNNTGISEDRKSNAKKNWKELIEKSVAAAKYRHFASEAERVDALNAAAFTLAERDLKIFVDQRNDNRKSMYEWEGKKKRALDELKGTQNLEEWKKVEDEWNKIKTKGKSPKAFLSSLKDIISSDGTLYPVISVIENRLKNEQKAESRDSQSTVNIPELTKSFEASIEAYYKDKIDAYSVEIARNEEAIQNMDIAYQQAVKGFYTKLKVKDAPPNELQSNSLPSASPSPQAAALTASLKKTLFDDKSSLSIFYKFLWICLTAVIVLALIYLILIPLKYIFFLTTAGEKISGKLESTISAPTASVIAAISAAPIIPILATIAAVGIGSAAIAAANPFGNAEPKKDDELNASTSEKSLRPVISSERLIQPVTSAPTDLQPLIVKIGELQKEVEKLRREVEKKETGSGTGTSATDIARELDGYFKERFTDIQDLIKYQDNSKETVFSKISGAETAFDTKIKETVGSSALLTDKSGNKTLFGLLGTPNATDQDTLFGRLNAFSGKIGEPKEQKNPSDSKPTGIFKDLETLSGKVGQISTTLGERSNDEKSDTLIGDVKRVISEANEIRNATTDIKTTATDIKTTATDIRENQLGRDGKNIRTQLKTLISGERYYVSPVAYEALKKLLPPTSPLLPCLELLMENAKKESSLERRLLTREQLTDILKPMMGDDTKEWKRQRNLIFRLTRVPRW